MILPIFVILFDVCNFYFLIKIESYFDKYKANTIQFGYDGIRVLTMPRDVSHTKDAFFIKKQNFNWFLVPHLALSCY